MAPEAEAVARDVTKQLRTVAQASATAGVAPGTGYSAPLSRYQRRIANRNAATRTASEKAHLCVEKVHVLASSSLSQPSGDYGVLANSVQKGPQSRFLNGNAPACQYGLLGYMPNGFCPFPRNSACQIADGAAASSNASQPSTGTLPRANIVGETSPSVFLERQLFNHYP